MNKKPKNEPEIQKRWDRGNSENLKTLPQGIIHL